MTLFNAPPGRSSLASRMRRPRTQGRSRTDSITRWVEVPRERFGGSLNDTPTGGEFSRERGGGLWLACVFVHVNTQELAPKHTYMQTERFPSPSRGEIVGEHEQTKWRTRSPLARARRTHKQEHSKNRMWQRIQYVAWFSRAIEHTKAA